MGKVKINIDIYSLIDEIKHCIDRSRYYEKLLSDLTRDSITCSGLTDEEIDSMEVLIDIYYRKADEQKKRAENLLENTFIKQKDQIYHRFNIIHGKDAVKMKESLKKPISQKARKENMKALKLVHEMTKEVI